MGLPLLQGVVSIVERVIDRLPDPKAKAEALQKLQEMQQSGDLQVIAGQIEIDKGEATNPKLFVSGWRPAIGWICGGGLAIQFIVRPLFLWGSALIGHPTPFPELEMGTMMELLFGMLGLAGLRTYEKRTGTEGNR